MQDPFSYRLDAMPRSQRVIRLVPRQKCSSFSAAIGLILGDCTDECAETKLIETFERLDLLLVSIEKFYKAGAFAALPDLANALATRLAEIGLPDASMIAGHVADCARQPNPIALCAVVSRLERTVQHAAHCIFTEVLGPKQP
jgi:hypothetical protein